MHSMHCIAIVLKACTQFDAACVVKRIAHLFLACTRQQWYARCTASARCSNLAVSRSVRFCVPQAWALALWCMTARWSAEAAPVGGSSDMADHQCCNLYTRSQSWCFSRNHKGSVSLLSRCGRWHHGARPRAGALCCGGARWHGSGRRQGGAAEPQGVRRRRRGRAARRRQGDSGCGSWQGPGSGRPGAAASTSHCRAWHRDQVALLCLPAASLPCFALARLPTCLAVKRAVRTGKDSPVIPPGISFF